MSQAAPRNDKSWPEYAAGQRLGGGHVVGAEDLRRQAVNLTPAVSAVVLPTRTGSKALQAVFVGFYCSCPTPASNAGRTRKETRPALFMSMWLSVAIAVSVCAVGVTIAALFR